MVDFRVIYYNVRVLVSHHDPYNALEGTQIAMTEGDKPLKYPVPLPNEITCVYPPSALLVNLPIALFRWRTAQIIWMILNGAGLILAAYLMWERGAVNAPLLAGILAGFLLANSEGLLFQGNVAGVVVSLCVIAAWCFLQQRFVLLGVICLALSLAIKPHDSGLVWMCFLLAGATHRKRAIQTLAVTAVIMLVAVFWVEQVSPSWTQELRANLAAVSARGSGNDPGPASLSNTIANSDINIQSVVAVVRDEPGFYNAVSYAFCAVLLLLWAFIFLRSSITNSRIWLALAFISALSMLPVYHRHHDAKLLMLSIPACTIIWSRRRLAGTIGVLVTALAFISNADVPRAILTALESATVFSTETVAGKLKIILLARPAPLALLAMAIFYLWACWRLEPDPPTTDAANHDRREFAVQPSI